MRAAHKEAEWCKSKCVPTIDEYMQHALLSVAMRTHVLPVIYFVGPKIPQAIIESAECNYLLEVMSLYARFLNDFNSYKVMSFKLILTNYLDFHLTDNITSICVCFL